MTIKKETCSIGHLQDWCQMSGNVWKKQGNPLVEWQGVSSYENQGYSPLENTREILCKKLRANQS